MTFESSSLILPELMVSEMAESLIGSEIIKIASEVNEKIKKGHKIHNLTIGDFNPKIFPIPELMRDEIIAAYKEGQTNYPPANGILELRESVADFIKEFQGLIYSSEEILIAAGARPLIYTLFQTLLNEGEKVIVPVPSWNNNHYCHLTGVEAIFVETKAENKFMPTAQEIKPFIQEAAMIALCSPLNPTGTTFTAEGLEEICELVLNENARRGKGQKPLYILYDQIYWVLTFGKTKHFNPVSLLPALKNYTIFIDGASKAFAATGIRVGWSFGPREIIEKMKTILGHIGAWAPKAEQYAVSRFLEEKEALENYLVHFKEEVHQRLQAFYNGFMKLREEGFRVDVIEPMAAIYLTVNFDLKNMKTESGHYLKETKDITHYLLEEAGLALVPFYAFGSSPDSSWYRLSVGNCKLEEIETVMKSLREALKKLS
jgi:aspartate aminotransferase